MAKRKKATGSPRTKAKRQKATDNAPATSPSQTFGSETVNAHEGTTTHTDRHTRADTRTHGIAEPIETDTQSASTTKRKLPQPPDVDVMTFDPHALPPKIGKRGADGKTYKLTIRQERFCQEYIRSDSKSAAYRKAYNCQDAKPKTVNQNASKLLTNTNVQFRIEQLKAAVMRQTTLSRAWVLEHLMENAAVCLGKKKLRMSRASKGGDVHEVEVTAHDASAANRALELLGKEAGMFVDRREVGGPGDFARMGDTELLEYIRQQQAELEHRTVDLMAIELQAPAPEKDSEAA